MAFLNFLFLCLYKICSMLLLNNWFLISRIIEVKGWIEIGNKVVSLSFMDVEVLNSGCWLGLSQLLVLISISSKRKLIQFYFHAPSCHGSLPNLYKKSALNLPNFNLHGIFFRCWWIARAK